MKKMKKMMALVIAVVMMMAMTISASAATINMAGVKKGETYTAYKILNYTAADSNTDGTNDVFSYYLTAAQYEEGNSEGLGAILESAGFDFEKSSDGTLYYVSNATTLTATGILNVLNTDAVKAKLATKALSKTTKTASADGTIEISSLEIGYYFIDSSLGSLCELKSFDDQEVIFEKNAMPSIDKKQRATVDGTFVDSVLDLNTGDTVYYQLEITDGEGTDADIVVTDTVSVGLALNDTIGVAKGSTPLVQNTDYTLTKSSSGFTLTLLSGFVKTLNKNEVVTVTYSAKVLPAAVVDSATANSNTATLTYSAQSLSDTVYVATYDFNLNKTDGTNPLAGAKFRLYDAATDGNEIKLASDSVGRYYVKADGTAEIEAGTVNIRGLKPGTYYLEETEAPAGYNKLDARKAVTITSGATSAVEVEVENKAGSLLPETGGIGTTIFYAAGALLVIGGVVVLVTRKRMENQ